MNFLRITLAGIAVGLAIAQDVEYGVDVSTAMHHGKISDNYAHLPWNVDPSIPTPERYQGMAVQPLGNRQAAYDEMIQKCVDFYGKKGSNCKNYEHDRIEMTLRQPQSMENYTDIGFKKIRAPDNVWKLIKDFWDRNKENQSKENWPAGNTYTNHWTAQTRMVNVEHDNLRGGGKKLKQAIWDAAKGTIADWTQSSLHQVSLYGIRVYTTGSILASHVDRLPLVSSAIICVDTDVDEPWPLEVISHDGKAYNVTMEPGDMVLYESHTVIHGRPFPLKGKFVANLFVHFEPEGHSTRHNAKLGIRKDPDKQYREDAARGVSGHEGENHINEKEDDFNEGLPIYLIPGSPEVANYINRNPNSEAARLAKLKAANSGATEAHMFAASGELKKLTALIEKQDHLVSAPDENGWTPLHEGARSGNVEVVRYLLSKGADINHRTGPTKKGYSVLAVAHQIHGADHPMSKFIEEAGGEILEPEL